jgi:hypothetical protein
LVKYPDGYVWAERVLAEKISKIAMHGRENDARLSFVPDDSFNLDYVRMGRQVDER